MTKVDLPQNIREVLGSINKKLLSCSADFDCYGGEGMGSLNELVKKKNGLFSV